MGTTVLGLYNGDEWVFRQNKQVSFLHQKH